MSRSLRSSVRPAERSTRGWGGAVAGRPRSNATWGAPHGSHASVEDFDLRLVVDDPGEWFFDVGVGVVVEDGREVVASFELSADNVAWRDADGARYDCALTPTDASMLARAGADLIGELWEDAERPNTWVFAGPRRVGEAVVNWASSRLGVRSEHGARDHRLYTLAEGIDPLLEIALRSCEWEPLF